MLDLLDLKYCADITDEGLRAVADGCPDLRVFNLFDCSKVTDVGLSALEVCYDLERIELAYRDDVTDEAIEVIAEGCNKLKHISLQNLSKVVGPGIEAIGLNCPLLETLIVVAC
jgi:Leucine Rich repeat